MVVDPKYLSDAAHFSGGYAPAIAVPGSTREIPAIVRGATTLLAIGAQSSLTGGATPMGETLLLTRAQSGRPHEMTRNSMAPAPYWTTCAAPSPSPRATWARTGCPG